MKTRWGHGGKLTYPDVLWSNSTLKTFCRDVSKYLRFLSADWEKESLDNYCSFAQRRRLSLTWGWPEVRSMAPIVQLLNRWTWPELFSLSLTRVSLVKTNAWKEAFFWQIAVSYQRCGSKVLTFVLGACQTNICIVKTQNTKPLSCLFIA